MAGMMQINSTYYEAAENYDTSKLGIFRKVVLPGNIPDIMSSVCVAFKSA